MTQFIVKKDERRKIVLEQPGSYEVLLVGDGAQVEISGRFRAKGAQQIEVTIVLRHQAKHTRADTELKGTATDNAALKFTGRIIIDPECGDTNSFLTERILLLSDTARAEAIPDLEIQTDDVKCSHAASITRIPEEQLFYLQSRGIGRSAAQQLIVEGFLE